MSLLLAVQQQSSMMAEKYSVWSTSTPFLYYGIFKSQHGVFYKLLLAILILATFVNHKFWLDGPCSNWTIPNQPVCRPTVAKRKFKGLHHSCLCARSCRKCCAQGGPNNLALHERTRPCGSCQYSHARW